MRLPLGCMASVMLTLSLAQAQEIRSTSTPVSPEELKLVAAQLRDYCRQHHFEIRSDATISVPASTALHWATTLSAEGLWPDVDYQSLDVSGWPQEKHYTRLLAMAAMGTSPTVPSREVILDAAKRALEAWCKGNYRSRNWWFNEIGVPKELAPVAVLLEGQMSQAARDYVVKKIRPIGPKSNQTGQNQVWFASNALIRAVLTNDTQQARLACDTLWKTVELADGIEGIQSDWSFHQHGPQQQFGNYGLSFAVEMQRLLYILRGTSLTMPPEKLKIFRHYLLEGQNWVYWRGRMDISGLGRHIWPETQQTKSEIFRRILANMSLGDPEAKLDYEAALRRHTLDAPNDLMGFRWFYRSDYGVFRAPEFFLSIKAASPRVLGMESLIKENLCGYYLADGATYLYRTGREYQDIFPVWDWRRLPGVTAIGGSEPLKTVSGVKHPSPFVGGLSNGTTGCAALNYQRDKVHAKKSWFLSGSTLVCLGSDIGAQGPRPIQTSVNQCWQRGPIRFQTNESEVPRDDANLRQIPKVRWVEHDGLHYEFPDHPTLWLGTQKQEGFWKKVVDNALTPQNLASGEVFSIWFDHGTEPAGQSYAYSAAPVEVIQSERWQVRSNTATLQAVSFDKGALAAVFWEPGILAVDPEHSLQVEAPCLVIIQGRELQVCDPTQKLASLVLRWNQKSYTVELPARPHGGASVRVELR